MSSDKSGSKYMGPDVREDGQENMIDVAADYKELELLRKFMTSSSKLMSRRRAGTDAQQQKTIKIAVKRARFLALLPYAGV